MVRVKAIRGETGTLNRIKNFEVSWESEHLCIGANTRTASYSRDGESSTSTTVPIKCRLPKGVTVFACFLQVKKEFEGIKPKINLTRIAHVFYH